MYDPGNQLTKPGSLDQFVSCGRCDICCSCVHHCHLCNPGSRGPVQQLQYNRSHWPLLEQLPGSLSQQRGGGLGGASGTGGSGPALKGIPYPAVTLGSKDGHMECHTPTPEGKKPSHTGIQPFTLGLSQCSTVHYSLVQDMTFREGQGGAHKLPITAQWQDHFITILQLTAVSVLQFRSVKCIHLALFNWNSLKGNF